MVPRTLGWPVGSQDPGFVWVAVTGWWGEWRGAVLASPGSPSWEQRVSRSRRPGAPSAAGGPAGPLEPAPHLPPSTRLPPSAGNSWATVAPPGTGVHQAPRPCQEQHPRPACPLYFPKLPALLPVRPPDFPPSSPTSRANRQPSMGTSRGVRGGGRGDTQTLPSQPPTLPHLTVTLHHPLCTQASCSPSDLPVAGGHDRPPTCVA